MKKKNTIFSQSYKVGITIFLILVVILSTIVVSLIRGFNGESLYNKSKVKETSSPTNSEPDTVYVDVIKKIIETDTLYVTCKKKHCEDIHTTIDTIK